MTKNPNYNSKNKIKLLAKKVKILLVLNQSIKIPKLYQNIGIYRDKTMADKLMHIPNDDEQNYPFCSPQSC